MHYKIQPDGRWLVKFDNHVISTFSLCEKLYDFKHLMNRSKKGGIGFNLAVGIWWSDVMSDLYDDIAKNQAQGKNEPPPIQNVFISAAKHWFKNKMDQYKTLAPQKYEKFGGTRIFEFPDLLDGKAFPMPLGALEMAQEYYENRACADARHWQIIATETAFGVLDDLIIGEDSKVIVAYQGRPDIVALDSQGRLMPLDHKTKDYPDLGSLIYEYKPHPQTAGYVYCLNKLVQSLGIENRTVDRCLVIVAGRFKPATPRNKNAPQKPRFVEVPVQYSQAELNEWRNEVVAKAHRLRDAIERNYFLRNESSCHWQYGSSCEFRPVCSQPPGVRDMILNRDYEILRPWNTGSPEERNKK
jgi:hypothetical protein